MSSRNYESRESTTAINSFSRRIRVHAVIELKSSGFLNDYRQVGVCTFRVEMRTGDTDRAGQMCKYCRAS